jgi:rod shape-determining protein MreC
MPLFWKNRKNGIVLAVLVSAHLVLISVQVPLGSERTLFTKVVFAVFAPIQRAVAGAASGLSGSWNGFFHLRGVRTENQRLLKELFFARQENLFLAERLRFLQGEGKTRENMAVLKKVFVTARVIGIDPSNPFRSIILNRGAVDGVRKDMAVCDRNGNLVGRVVEPVSLKEAKVQLITDDEAGVSVISGTDRIVGVLSGDANGACRIRYVMNTTPGGQEGEDLFTTGFDRLFPPGIRVGRITSVVTDASLFKTIRVAPFFLFNDLGQVAVITERFEELF